MRVRPTLTLPRRGLGIWGLGVGLGKFLGAADEIGDFADQVGEVIVVDPIVERLAMQVIHRVSIVFSQPDPLPAAVLSQLAEAGVDMPAGRVMDSGHFPNQRNGSATDSQPALFRGIPPVAGRHQSLAFSLHRAGVPHQNFRLGIVQYSYGSGELMPEL